MDALELWVLLSLWFIPGILCFVVAETRNAGGGSWLCWGTLFGVFALAALLVSSSPRRKKCTGCAELILAEAKLCKHCYTVVELDPATSYEVAGNMLTREQVAREARRRARSDLSAVQSARVGEREQDCEAPMPSEPIRASAVQDGLLPTSTDPD